MPKFLLERGGERYRSFLQQFFGCVIEDLFLSIGEASNRGQYACAQ